MDEAAALATVLNLELRAIRKEKGIAEGQLIHAGLIANPDIDAAWRSSSDLDVQNTEIDLLFDLTDILAKRGLRKARARIRVEEVSWEIAAQEWRLVNDVRRAFITVLYVGEAMKLNRQQSRIAARSLASVKARYTRGAATELDVIVAEGGVSEIERRKIRLTGARRQAIQQLNQLVGLPPTHTTKIQKLDKPLAYLPISDDPGSFVERLRSQRPDLHAAEKAYQGAERELQLAYRGRIPPIQLGPSFENDDGENSTGIALGIGLPLFNRNQGEIAVKLAERNQKREQYIARLHGARNDFYSAWSDYESVDKELAFYFSNVVPRLDRSLLLTEKAFKEGEIDLFQVLLLQQRVLQSKREVLERRRDFHMAKVAVEEATGPARLESDEEVPKKPIR